MKNKTKQRKHAPFNVVDAGILLLLLAVLLVFVYFVFFADHIPLGDPAEGSGEERVVYTLEIRGIDNALLDSDLSLPILVGEEIYHVNSSYVVGKVLSVSTAMPYMAATSSVTADGELIYAQHPMKSSFLIEVETTASFVDGSYMINGKILRIGERFNVATPYFTAEVYCKDIKEVASDE